jgi:hypothetical protein
MSQTYGMPSPSEHAPRQLRLPARFLVLIEAGGSQVARLFLADRAPAGEFDAGVQEVTQMTSGLTPLHGALGSDWDVALKGHSSAERAVAQVYTLDL